MSTEHSSRVSAAMDDMRDPEVASALRAEQAQQPASPCARCTKLEGVLDRADAHTEMLMRSIKNLETKLKAAEYAARVNWDGWQQEIARSPSALTSTERDETVKPHIYMPDYQAMGDCRVCGHEQDKPWHTLPSTNSGGA